MHVVFGACMCLVPSSASNGITQVHALVHLTSLFTVTSSPLILSITHSFSHFPFHYGSATPRPHFSPPYFRSVALPCPALPFLPSFLHPTMIPLFLCLWLLHLASLLSASPTLQQDDTQEVEQLLARRQTSYLPITGIQEFGVQPRLEIRQLQQNADQWNLFLLGLSRFQNTNQSQMNSYYQIAGIHGRPYIPWNGVGPAPHQDSPGFCQHVSNVFVCWHRPYLALFEQTLFRHIVQVVDTFPAGRQRQRYAEAALSWRLPYWDWAMTVADEEFAFPSSLQAENVTVTMPNGTNVIPNPLYAYRFHPVSVSDFYYSPVSLPSSPSTFTLLTILVRPLESDKTLPDFLGHQRNEPRRPPQSHPGQQSSLFPESLVQSFHVLRQLHRVWQRGMDAAWYIERRQPRVSARRHSFHRRLKWAHDILGLLCVRSLILASPCHG